MGNKIKLILGKNHLKRIEIHDEYCYSGWGFVPYHEDKIKIFGWERVIQRIKAHWTINTNSYDTWEDFEKSSESKYNYYMTTNLSPDDCAYLHRNNKVYLKASARIFTKDKDYIIFFNSKASAEKWAADLVKDQNLGDGLIYMP